MKKLLIFFLFLNISTAFAQQKYSIQITGGYSLPAGDMKGTYPDNPDTVTSDVVKTYLLSKGYNLGITGKYFIDVNTRLTAGITYNFFSQDKDYTFPSGAARKIENRMNILLIHAGLDFVLNPTSKVRPFAGLDLSANLFSGRIETTGDSLILNTRKSEVRYGVQAGAGLDVTFSKTLGGVFGAKYCFSNLIGKSGKTTSTTTQTDTEEIIGANGEEVSLNDIESGSRKAKGIYFVQFYAGLSYYFGGKVKFKK